MNIYTRYKIRNIIKQNIGFYAYETTGFATVNTINDAINILKANDADATILKKSFNSFMSESYVRDLMD